MLKPKLRLLLGQYLAITASSMLLIAYLYKANIVTLSYQGR